MAENFEVFAPSIARCMERLGRLGCTVEKVLPSPLAEERVLRLGKEAVTQTSQTAINDFLYGAGYWLFLIDEVGEDIACVFLRCDDLGNEGVAAYLSRTYSRQYRVSSSTCVVERGGWDQLGGRLVYFGDLFARAEAGIASKSAARIWCFINYGQHLAYYEWQFDWCYAFIRPKDQVRRVTRQYQFCHEWLSPIRWHDSVDYRSEDEFLIALSKGDFEYNMRNQEALFRLGNPKWVASS